MVPVTGYFREFSECVAGAGEAGAGLQQMIGLAGQPQLFSEVETAMRLEQLTLPGEQEVCRVVNPVRPYPTRLHEPGLFRR